MLVITSNYPEQMPDGSVSGAKVMLDGIDDHAGWHIPLSLPKEYLKNLKARLWHFARR